MHAVWNVTVKYLTAKGDNSRIEISQTNAIKIQICLESKQIGLASAVMLVVILFHEGAKEKKTVQPTCWSAATYWLNYQSHCF